MKNLGRRGILAAGAALAVAPAARAPGWLSRPADQVRRAAFPPAARPTSSAACWRSALSEILGQQVMVENKPGAAGNIGSGLVAEAKPDGYTLLVGNSIMSIVPALYDKLGYDPRERSRCRGALHHGADDHRGAGGRREVARRTGRAAAQGTRQAFLSVARQRQPDPHQQPAAHPARRRRGACMCPIAARRRRSRIRSPAATPSRSTRWAACKGFIDAGHLHRARGLLGQAPGGTCPTCRRCRRNRIPVQRQHLEHDLRAGRHAADRSSTSSTPPSTRRSRIPS